MTPEEERKRMLQMRLWAKNLLEEQPKPRSQMTPKDKVLTIISMIVDAIIIGLLVLTLVVNSCQICYMTNAGATTYKSCKNVADAMETGLPSEVIYIYEGKTPEGSGDLYGLGSSINLTITK
jgi:hypothetical protein